MKAWNHHLPPKQVDHRPSKKADKKQPKVYHFACGDDNSCALHATVVACSKSDAIKILQTAIKANKEIKLKEDEARKPSLGGVEWLNIKLSPNMVTKDKVVKIVPLSEGVHPPD